MDIRAIRCMEVIVRRGNTIMMRLEAPLRTDIEGGCSCPYCKEHPEKVPQWDTLCVSMSKRPGENDFSWTCHNPEGK